jgi:hypothetical protein
MVGGCVHLREISPSGRIDSTSAKESRTLFQSHSDLLPRGRLDIEMEAQGLAQARG